MVRIYEKNGVGETSLQIKIKWKPEKRKKRGRL